MATFSDWVNKWLPQMAHVSTGAFLTLALALHVGPLYATGAVLTFASLKEGVFDKLTETKSLQGSGWQDWGFWLAGIAVGLIPLIK